VLIIDDTNYRQFIGNGQQVLAGGAWRHLSLVPSPHKRGEQPRAVRFRDSSIDGGYGAGVVIPKADRIARAKHLEETQSRISDHIDFDAWDQDGIPYCWCNGGTQAASTFRRMMGLPFVHFSAASVGAIASGYRIRGGYGGETLEVLSDLGAVDVKMWGNNAVSRSLDTPESQENRKHHIVTEFVECETWDETATCAVLNLPMSCDYNWWSHVVMGCEILPNENEDLRIRNSWSESWGDKNKHGKGGFGILRGSRRIPSYCFAVRQVTASEI
jgi:hypothetical protein